MIEQQRNFMEPVGASWTVCYLQVKEGDRWRCMRCGSCCYTDFEDEWLNFIDFENAAPLTPNSCPHLSILNDKPHCGIYPCRSNTCRAFPFSLRKVEDGRYVLVIHNRCKGFGRGRVINLRRRIVSCVRLANREFNAEMSIDFTGFEQSFSVLLRRKNKRKKGKKIEERLSS